MLKKIVCSLVFACAIGAVSQTPTCSSLTLGTNGAFNGFVSSPNDAWHLDVSNAPIDPNSTKIITSAADLAGSTLHPTFGSPSSGGFGIPYVVVDSSTTPGAPLVIKLFPADSDITLNPIPAGLPIEDNPGQCPTDSQDRHAVVIDRNQCVAYEMYQAAQCKGAWSASSSAVWDLTSSEQRPYGFTSTDAAGLSVFSGLIRYDEIVAGAINHAIRFTARHTKSNSNNGFFTYPASHAAGNSSSTDNIMGMRIRLKANYDISGFSTTNQIILKAMKQYGMILADNGSNLFFQGTEDSRWNDTDLSNLKTVPASAFDVIQMGAVYDVTTAPKGAVPQITSFTASATTVPSGTPVTLTPTVTGASYSYIDKVGFVRGPVTVTPTATTTYLLTSRNAFGTTSTPLTITVSGKGVAPTLTITPIATQTFGVAPFAVASTSNSTGAITYSVVSGPATISGSTVTVTGAGTVTIKASQAAAGTFSAGTVTASFTVNPGSPLLAFVTVPNQLYPTAAFTVSTTTQSTGSISYSVVSGPATVAGNAVTLTGTGTVTLQASQAAAGNYAAATATTTFTVTAGATNLQFAAIPTQVYGVLPFAVNATSASPGTITYSIVSGPAVISGNTVTITGIGTVVVQAVQVAAGSYAAASTTASFVVTPAKPNLQLMPIANQTFGVPPFTVSASSNSSGAITYSIVSGPATISGNTVTLTGTGTVVLQALQAASGNYGAVTVTTSFGVTAAVTALTFGPIADQPFGITVPLSAASPSPGAITYSVVSGPVAISGNLLTSTGVGKVVVQATQAASGGFPAASATAVFHIVAAVPVLTFTPIADQILGVLPFAITASSASTGTISYSVVAGHATISGNVVSLTGLGAVTVRARQAPSATYTQTDVSTTFNVLP